MAILRSLAAVFLLAGCAAAPRNDDLALARSLVGEARQAGAALYAPTELDRATRVLSEAEQALRRNDTAQAKQLLDEATVDAQVALAKIGQPGARETCRCVVNEPWRIAS